MLSSRHLRIVLFITLLIILLIIAITIIISNSQINQKPKNPQSTEQTNGDGQKWYVKFSVSNQKATAYVGEGIPIGASGNHCFIGGVATHPLYPVNSGGHPLQPAIPFGTTIYLNKPLEIQGSSYLSFKVMDTGDVNFRLWPEHPYWLDIYWGNANYYSRLSSQKFGTNIVSYSWVEEWR